MGRRADCSAADARALLGHARDFLEVASVASDKVRATNAVSAGIAASDAACCARLGSRSRAESHSDATRLLSTVEPHGAQMSRLLARLLAMKDDAHYGVRTISDAKAANAIRWASRLVGLAAEVVEL